MKTIVAGSRSIQTRWPVLQAMSEAPWEITSVVSGGARGVDTFAIEIAEELMLPCEIYLANWAKYGRGAGHRRNMLMAQNAEALVAVWEGDSPGTRNMIKTAELLKLKIHVLRIPPHI